MIGERIKEARTHASMTQEELAAKSGISRSYLAAIEKDHYNPSIKTLKKIAAACEKKLFFFMSDV